MTAKISYTTFDCDHRKIVTAIATFDTQGHVKPVYIGIDGVSYKVHSAWMQPSFKNHLTFHCEIIDGDRIKPIDLSYHKTEDVWSIPKYFY